MLKPNELEILKVLWRDGPLKPADIQDQLFEPVKNLALRAQLTSLVKRGQLKRRRRSTRPPAANSVRHTGYICACHAKMTAAVVLIGVDVSIALA